MAEQTTPLQQPVKASKIVDDGPLKVTDIEATTVKTDNLEANAGTEISVNDDIQVGNLDATDIDTTDIQSTNQPQPWGIPTTASVAGTIPCWDDYFDPTIPKSMGFVCRRAGVYKFRCKGGPSPTFADESAHAVTVFHNTATFSLSGSAAGSTGTAVDRTLAVGDTIFIRNDTLATHQYVQVCNADGWM